MHVICVIHMGVMMRTDALCCTFLWTLLLLCILLLCCVLMHIMLMVMVHILMRIIVVLHISCMMHINAYYAYCYDAYYYEDYLGFVY